MQNRLLIAGAVSTVVVILFLFAGSIPGDHGEQTVIRFAMPCQISGFASLIVTFLFVNLPPRLGSVLHAYTK